MSCCSSSSSPPLEHGAAAPALDLLDEYWFFSNTLVSNSTSSSNRAMTMKKPPLLPRSPSTSTATGEKAWGSAGPSRLGCRRLLWTPSLPSSRVGTMESPSNTKKDDDLEEEQEAGAASASAGQQLQVQVAADEVDDDDLNWSSIYEGVLRTRMAEGVGSGRSALRRAPSMPVPSTATDHHHHQEKSDGRLQTKSTGTATRRLLRHSHSTLGRHTPPNSKAAEQRAPDGNHESGQRRRESSQQPAVLVRSKKQAMRGFPSQDNKCRSSNDLESIEVQGFRDLGFVFPGLKQQQVRAHGGPGRRSEEWPALVRALSAAEMKDQLRIWAQAVACNVRHEQEC